MEGAMRLGVRCGNFVSKREKMSTELQTRARIEIERRKLNEERRKKQVKRFASIKCLVNITRIILVTIYRNSHYFETF